MLGVARLTARALVGRAARDAARRDVRRAIAADESDEQPLHVGLGEIMFVRSWAVPKIRIPPAPPPPPPPPPAPTLPPLSAGKPSAKPLPPAFVAPAPVPPAACEWNCIGLATSGVSPSMPVPWSPPPPPPPPPFA